MADPHVPGDDGLIDLPCGERLHPSDLDLGMRELSCECGDNHAVVMDVHPLGRFIPEFLVETLRETIATDDEFEEFSMPHAIAMVREEYPEDVAVGDCSGDGDVGFGLVWIADFDARHLHTIIVELIVDMMEHAIGHAEDGPTVQEFESKLETFDVDEFVDLYRKEREFEDEFDTAL